LGKQRVTGYVRKTVQLQQAILRITVAFERSPASDVHRCNRTRYQRRTNQQKAMTMQRIFLGTHHDDSLLLRKPEQPLKAFLKVWGLAASSVVYQPILPVITRVQRPATKLVTEELIDDLGVCQLRHQWLAVELRKPEAPWAAAHVADHLDFVAKQNAQKVRHLLIGVPDGE